MNKKRAMQYLSHFQGVQKLRCTSQFWHHKLQQRLILRVPPRFDHLKATNCGTGDLSHSDWFAGYIHAGAAATRVSQEIKSCTSFVVYTELK